MPFAELFDEISYKNFCRDYIGLVAGRIGVNAIAWKEGYRIFGCSRDLLITMRRSKKDNSAYTWLYTTMHKPDLGYEEDKIIRKNPTWKRMSF